MCFTLKLLPLSTHPIYEKNDYITNKVKCDNSKIILPIGTPAEVRDVLISSLNLCVHPVLGKGSAVVVESLNLLFHHQCFHCSICLKPLKCEDVGTNIKVRGCNVHCEDCSFNDKG